MEKAVVASPKSILLLLVVQYGWSGNILIDVGIPIFIKCGNME